MPAAAYQPVPSDNDDGNSSIPQPHPKKVHRLSRFLKLALFAVALCLVALVSFKAGQWSVPRPTFSDSIHQTEEIIEEQDDVAVTPAPDVEDEIDYSDMPGNGKYSVG